MAKGTKRASPGAEEEKSGLSNAELGEEDAQKLTEIQRDLARVELVLERQAQATLRPVYEKRRAVVRTIPNFWPVALMNHSLFAYHAQHSADQTALNYLEDLWVEKDPNEHRCFTIEFYFKENPLFSDTVLKKEYKFVKPPAAENEVADENGITPSMLDFSWERDVEVSTTKINWKDADKALTKVYPRKVGEDEDDIADPGSFFNFFEHRADPSEIGVVIANEIFPEAIEYFLGNVDGEITDSEDEDDDDDDDDAEEIDLEKPRSKKRKV
ncbi:Protein SET [Psilocybe cubensis]|uniref:Protein SET n=2 Tax=Psilocybe cubensis TaxID=181762 RepID=A0A8H7YBB1_PSICU|nr:Protein SET [Psilocybe cubensis]KAH9487076.1 Protein SET [Psilocybe cubensis]